MNLKGSLKNEKEVELLRDKSANIDGLQIRYALYKISAKAKPVYTVIAYDAEDTSYVVFKSLILAEEFYELVSDNEVDTASFDGIAADFLYERGNAV